MKTIKKLLLNVMLMTFMLVMGSMTVSAATTTQNLGQNKWVNYDGKVDTYYKITVPNDGYITLSVANPSGSYMDVDMHNKSKKYLGGIIFTDKKNDTATYAVAKGTYYLRAYQTKGFQLKYKFTKAVNKSNYCIGKAVKLKKNAKVTVVQSPMNNYDRWYKITLTKKQKINMSIIGSGSMTLYDADCEQVSLKSNYKSGTETYVTKQAQKKGTYYVRVRSYHNYSQAEMCTFSWK